MGNRIRELRKQRAAELGPTFTAAELARNLKVTESALLRWERGDTRPTKQHAKELAKWLHVTVEELGLDDDV